MDKVIDIGIACSLGLSINIWFSLLKYTWANTPTQRQVSIILPAAAMIITWAISSNLFLSLGMIGALSIIRYRAPVKSPLELAILFSYITIGISSGVNPKYAILLFAVILCAPLVDLAIKYFFPRNFKSSQYTDFEFLVTAKINSLGISDLKHDSFDRGSVSYVNEVTEMDSDNKILELGIGANSFSDALKIQKELEKCGIPQSVSIRSLSS